MLPNDKENAQIKCKDNSKSFKKWFEDKINVLLDRYVMSKDPNLIENLWNIISVG